MSSVTLFIGFPDVLVISQAKFFCCLTKFLNVSIVCIISFGTAFSLIDLISERPDVPPRIPVRLVVVSTPPRPLNGVVVVVVAVVAAADVVVTAGNELNKLPAVVVESENPVEAVVVVLGVEKLNKPVDGAALVVVAIVIAGAAVGIPNGIVGFAADAEPIAVKNVDLEPSSLVSGTFLAAAVLAPAVTEVVVVAGVPNNKPVVGGVGVAKMVACGVEILLAVVWVGPNVSPVVVVTGVAELNVVGFVCGVKTKVGIACGIDDDNPKLSGADDPKLSVVCGVGPKVKGAAAVVVLVC